MARRLPVARSIPGSLANFMLRNASMPCAVRNCAILNFKTASPIVEIAPSERMLNGVTSAVSTCGIPMGMLSRSLFIRLVSVD